jgi:hypothetical protein
VLLALLLVTGSDGARILGVFPFLSKSHMFVQRALTLELAVRGHQVTGVTLLLERKIVPNCRQIEVKIDVATATGGRGKRKLTGNGTLSWSEIYPFKRAENCKLIGNEIYLLNVRTIVNC